MTKTQIDRAAVSEILLPQLLSEHGIDNAKPGKNFPCIFPDHNDSNPSACLYRKNGVLRYRCFGKCRIDEDGIGLLSRLTRKEGRPLFLEVERRTGLGAGRPGNTAPAARSYQGGKAAPRAQSAQGAKGQKQAKTLTTSSAPAVLEPSAAALEAVQKEEAAQKQAQERREYVEVCAARYAECTYLSDVREISDKVAHRFGVGYDPHSPAGFPAIAIPTGDGSSYVLRNIDPAADKSRRYQKRGPTQPFNFEAFFEEGEKPVFVVEGEIDAMSVIEAGQKCVGLGSTSQVDHVLSKLQNEKRNGRSVTAPVFLILDDDDSGRKAAGKLKEGLEKLDVTVYLPAGFYAKKGEDAGTYHDANQYLTENREGFISALEYAPYEVELQDEADKTAKRDEYYSKYRALTFIDSFWEDCKRDGGGRAIPTGFKSLDEVLDGGLYVGLYILGGVPSAGKTTVVHQIADYIAASGHDVLFFSLEMARSELMAKSVSRLTKVMTVETGGNSHYPKTTRGILHGEKWSGYSDDEINLMWDALGRYQKTSAPFMYIIEGAMAESGIGAEEVRRAVSTHIELTGRKPVVVLDYLQLLKPYNDRATDKQIADRNVLTLKRICTRYGVPVIAISSLSRQGYKGGVQMENFKDSGGIEYTADALLGLQFPEGVDIEEGKKRNPRDIQIAVLKNRNGETGRVLSFRYFPMFNLYVEAGAEEASPSDGVF